MFCFHDERLSNSQHVYRSVEIIAALSAFRHLLRAKHGVPETRLAIRASHRCERAAIFRNPQARSQQDEHHLAGNLRLHESRVNRTEENGSTLENQHPRVDASLYKAHRTECNEVASGILTCDQHAHASKMPGANA